MERAISHNRRRPILTLGRLVQNLGYRPKTRILKGSSIHWPRTNAVVTTACHEVMRRPGIGRYDADRET